MKKISNQLLKNYKQIVLFLTLLLIAHSPKVSANNITIENASIVSQNTGEGTAMIGFDIKWSNSWRVSFGPSNWDAAWVFIKYRVNDGDWQHASLSYVDGTGANDGHIVPTGAEINSKADHLDIESYSHGVFIYANSNLSQSTDNANYTGAQLKWEYDYDGVLSSDNIDIKIFAIEMVYVPEGNYMLGAQKTGLEQKYIRNTASDDPITITNEGALDFAIADDPDDGVSKTDYSLAASFPKGYNSYYMMKYEITQQQFVDYLNTIPTTEINNKSRIGVQTTYRFGLSKSSNIVSSIYPYLPMNFMKWEDLANYLDWAALRPMTELEFEKAARGSDSYNIAGQYAWGISTIVTDVYTYSNADAEDEGIATNYGDGQGNAICLTTSSSYPVRVGIFSANADCSSRAEAGSSYYGIMELSGNVTEFVINAADATGALFDGTHGNGEFDGFNNFDVSSWPSDSNGIGKKGGSFGDVANRLLVSDRGLMTVTLVRNQKFGGRGVRTAP
ncbi:formylglycine-generating enzyme family protein [Flammeovirga kamogawensis]|uniref:Formylglycine-generating enzyme family protein n=1 Tax=Flammeovirga kamogawensis TaxID=373891 RepID=A0ABX8H2V9_9BACT|nr:SUMF1/EgtB/PvdO family nonheme iron enzyme [Flammeovirga kamogawensis]MBB6462618.1 hypothetical protein [Flammeovirga kamogawensis]QWG09637.1 formylglycine-generating enzyme family protein [Flammeovirga kamogawensis]TRX65151.1 formylglycine-generating enzyme family protein [Flammeovirga kamogawensis]